MWTNCSDAPGHGRDPRLTVDMTKESTLRAPVLGEAEQHVVDAETLVLEPEGEGPSHRTVTLWKRPPQI